MECLVALNNSCKNMSKKMVCTMQQTISDEKCVKELLEKMKNYLHICGIVLALILDLIIEKAEHYKCFAKKPLDIGSNIAQVVFFSIWTNLPLNLEGKLMQSIQDNRHKISFWARCVSTVVPGLISFLFSGNCDWKLEHLLTFKPYWVLIIYAICTFVGCKLCEYYYKRFCEARSNEPESIALNIINQ